VAVASGNGVKKSSFARLNIVHEVTHLARVLGYVSAEGGGGLLSELRISRGALHLDGGVSNFLFGM